MLQTISLDEKRYPETICADEIINSINRQITKRKSEEIVVDISFLNVIDACRVSMLCSTTHYISHPDGKISWLINNKDVENFTSSMNIGNSEFMLVK